MTVPSRWVLAPTRSAETTARVTSCGRNELRPAEFQTGKQLTPSIIIAAFSFVLALAPGVTGAATQAAPAPPPVAPPAATPAPPPTPTPAPAAPTTTTTTTPPAAPDAAAAKPETTPPPPPPAASAPLSPAPPAKAPVVSTATDTATVREPATLVDFFRPTVTDAVMAVFALILLLFAWRLTATTRELVSNATAQSDVNRRAIEASERAAEAARRSAEAAEKSVAVVQDTTARQLRAYVTVKEFLQGPVKDDKQHLHGWVFQVVWQNTGVTPTKGFRYWAALRQFENGIPADFDFAPPMSSDFAGGELGSASTVTSGTLFVPQQDVAQIQSGARKAVLYGKADYQDVLDQKRETTFAVELVIVSDPGGANATPFTFSYHPRHNAAS